MMTQSQKATLHRLARMAVKHNDYGALDAYVTAYAERARSSLNKPVSTDAAAGHGRPGNGISSPVQPRRTPEGIPTPADAWKPLGWWQRLFRILP